jgi:hypothetical protein
MVYYIDYEGNPATAFYDGPSTSGYTQVNFTATSITDPGGAEVLNCT